LAESKNIKNTPKFWEILTQLWKSLNILTETGNCPKVNGTNSTLHNFLNLFWDSALHSPTHFFASDLNSTLFHSLPYISFFLYISDKVRIENLCASVIPDVTLWRVEEDLTGVKLWTLAACLVWQAADIVLESFEFTGSIDSHSCETLP
jgi:hypothetical protein